MAAVSSLPSPSLPAASRAPPALATPMGAGPAAPAAADEGAAACAFAWDDPQELLLYSDLLADGTRRARLRIEGMSCAACAVTIEQALARLPGVLQARVQAASGRAEVQLAPQRGTSLAAVAQAVAQAGYRAWPATHWLAQDERRSARRKALWRLFVASFCAMQVMMYTWPLYVAAPEDVAPDARQLLLWASWVLTLPVLLFASGPFFASALRDLRAGRIGMDVPVALAIGLTFAAGTVVTFDAHAPLGAETYFDSLTMFVALLLGARYLEQAARERTAGALEALAQRLPQSVLRLARADAPPADDWTSVAGEKVASSQLQPGDVLRVLPGQALPADGTLLEGGAQLDEALLTGESLPVAHAVGAPLLAGSIVHGQPLVMRVTALGSGTRYGQIVELMQRAASDKPELARLADRIARPFLWAVLLLASLGAAWWTHSVDAGRGLAVALAVLVVTCPCALSLATPAALLAAAGNLARRGLWLQKLQALETLAQVTRVAFDKTGTLTEDRLQCEGWQRLDAAGGGTAAAPPQALGRALALARASTHPAARALVDALEAAGTRPADEVRAPRELAGQGVEAQAADGGAPLRLGSAAFVGLDGAAPPDGDGPAVYYADDAVRLRFDLREQPRADAAAAVAALHALGIRTALLSGDRPQAAARLGATLGIDDARGGLRPEDKLAAVAAWQRQGEVVAMVGDGINDAPVLARADVSLALAEGADVSRSGADLVLAGGRLRELAQAVALARRTRRVVRQNIGWALVYNLGSVPLALAGLITPLAAGIGMAASSLLVVANALRLARALPARA
jgi:Cu2+-exporting ATPase